MKTVYVVRHAKSSWDDPLQDDFDRPLNSRGRKDAPRMGKRLQERGLHPDLILSSPAERALSSCLIIAENIRYSLNRVVLDQRLYLADEGQLLAVIHSLNDAHDEVMIFAHNPGLTDFVNRVAGQAVTNNLPTCGVVALQFSVQSWTCVEWGSAKVIFLDYPKGIKEG